MFPTPELQVLSCLIHFLGLAAITYIISIKSVEDLSSWKALSRMTWPRICVFLALLDSWFFLCTSGILIFGLGLDGDSAVCTSGIYICILFYSTSKMLIYLFLIEKVYIVWSNGDTRLESRVYLVCCVTVGLYTIIMAIMILGRIARFRDGDGACVIGLKTFASIPLFTYDLYINVFLNGLFLWPLLKSNLANPKLRRVATRTLIASTAALTTSAVNIIVLVIMRERGELGWLCLTSCGADVIINACALFWATRTHTESSTAGRDASLDLGEDSGIFKIVSPSYIASHQPSSASIPREAPNTTHHSGRTTMDSGFADVPLPDSPT
ncbi:hypothetical protein C8J57DRAFT_1053105 [Mycena rebaudengoi]|nr:hypothetical protein C8J57DRAFT_1053105 [Mycena rebaudengoi]